MFPIAIAPVNGGANVTVAPDIGRNVLFGVAEPYNCAVIVTVEPRSEIAAVVLK